MADNKWQNGSKSPGLGSYEKLLLKIYVFAAKLTRQTQV